MLRPFRLTLDLGHDRMWLQRNRAAAEFTRDRTGLFTLLEGDHFNILHVSPGSPAATAGLHAGDRIVAIDGEAVGPGFFAGAKASWARAAAGSAVSLTKADGKTVKLTLADYF
jgi:predicted metalloprotease with PDZ domain